MWLWRWTARLATPAYEWDCFVGYVLTCTTDPWSIFTTGQRARPHHTKPLDISNLNVIPDYSDSIAQRWNHLEILKWNNNDEYWFDPNGQGLESFTNLKELYVDGGRFRFFGSENRAMADMKNHPNIFLFYKLCKNNPLERVSIRHLKVPKAFDEKFVQNVLIKFVRNSPSTLVWFRSDLTTANIRMLQLERPSIQFVN